MQANELRIGNWVRSPYGDISQIEALLQRAAIVSNGGMFPYNQLKHVELSPEILEQCGFEISVGNSTSNYKYYASNGFVDVKFWNDTTTVYMCIGGVKCPLTHITGLHQLQNFIYFTFNTELTWNRKQ